MNSKANKINLTLIFLFAFTISYSQEQLRPLSGILKTNFNNEKSYSLKSTSTATLVELPFFDDFSYAYKTPFPSGNLWQDSNVYVNTGFAIAPVSIGVATFDGLNKKGYPYNIQAPVNISSRADILTSKAINLKQSGAFVYSPADSLYLSFYYQAEGNGEAPEPNDSLCLDFFKPNQNKWEKVWGRKGYNPGPTDTNFYMVMIAIKDTAYFDSLFQFRFRNNATLSGSLDHWHVDYVYLNKNRNITDTVIEDDAFVYKGTPLLRNYSSMPFRQFAPTEMATSLSSFIRNNHTGVKNTSYDYEIYDKSNVLVHSYNGGNANISPFFSNGYSNVPQHANPPLSYSIPFPLTDTAIFTTRYMIFSNPDLVRQNDTIETKQILSNYYAYDDGTAEVGYYLNTYGAKTAVRFTLNQIDTLKSVRIFFDPIVDGVTILGSSFRIMVWADGGNGPSITNVIYRDSLEYPRYADSGYYVIPEYKLTSCLPLGIGTYYIGLQQTTNQALNIGFDKNTNHSDALYYDIGNGWQQSSIKGSIMINPVMGCYEAPIPVGINELSEGPPRMELFPNPNDGKFIIRHTSDLIFERIKIVDMVGKTVIENTINSNSEYDLSGLTSGIYYVYLLNQNITSKPIKLVISR